MEIIYCFFHRIIDSNDRKITISFPRCVLLNSSLAIALTCSTANCVQVVIIKVQITFLWRKLREYDSKKFHLRGSAFAFLGGNEVCAAESKIG